jgi:alpha-N-arabinofuranosidase
LIRNRAFQGSTKFPSSLEAWSGVEGSSLSLKNLDDPLSTALPTSVNVKGSGTAGLTNAGFWGIDVRPQKYTGSFYVKGSYKGSFTASLLSSSGKVLATAKVASKSVANDWVQHKFVLTPKAKASDSKNTFSLTFDASVRFGMDMIFPRTLANSF